MVRQFRCLEPYDVSSRRVWELREPYWPSYVETGDATTHPIWHIGNVPFGKEGKQTYIKNVLHVRTITKNLVSVGQIVEQRMQVWFNQGSCFIEKEGQLLACGRQMFILDSNEMKSAMFAKGTKAESDIELWHKQFGHINLQKLKVMQLKGVVIRVPTFKEWERLKAYVLWNIHIMHILQFGIIHRPLMYIWLWMNLFIIDIEELLIYKVHEDTTLILLQKPII